MLQPLFGRPPPSAYLCIYISPLSTHTHVSHKRSGKKTIGLARGNPGARDCTPVAVTRHECNARCQQTRKAGSGLLGQSFLGSPPLEAASAPQSPVFAPVCAMRPRILGLSKTFHTSGATSGAERSLRQQRQQSVGHCPSRARAPKTNSPTPSPCSGTCPSQPARPTQSGDGCQAAPARLPRGWVFIPNSAVSLRRPSVFMRLEK